MSATIRTVCGSCGDVELPADAAWLEIPVRAGQRGVVHFECSGCGRAQSQEVAERATVLLLRAGIEVGAMNVSAKAQHPGDPNIDRRS